MASTLSPASDVQRSSVQRRLADAAYERLYEPVMQLRARGLSLNSIAHELNAQGERSRYGLPFTPELVRRVLARAERLRREAKASTPDEEFRNGEAITIV